MSLLSTCQDVVDASRSSEFVVGASVLCAFEALTGVICFFFALHHRSEKTTQFRHYAHFMAWAALAGAFVWFTVLKRTSFDREATVTRDCASRNALKAQSSAWYAVFAVFRPVSVILFSLGKSVPLLRLFDISNISHGSRRRKITRNTRLTVTAVFSVNIIAISTSSWWSVATRTRLFSLYTDFGGSFCGPNATQAVVDATRVISEQSRLADQLFGISAVCYSILNICVIVMYVIAVSRTRRKVVALLHTVVEQATQDDCANLAAAPHGSFPSKFHSLQSFVYRTYAMMCVLFIALIYRTLHTGLMGVGMTIGPNPTCEGRCSTCQNPAYLISSVMQFSTANVVSIGFLDEVFSTLFGIWGLLPHHALRHNKVVTSIDQPDSSSKVSDNMQGISLGDGHAHASLL
jgi:hypothetical protein